MVQRCLNLSALRRLTCSVAIVAAAGQLASPTGAQPAEAIDFTRDVRPILADHCFHCHGPDPATREAGLRLDIWESTDQTLAVDYAVLPGDADNSELFYRVSADDESMRMPPAETGKPLDPEQIAVLEAWIDQGAEFKTHWAFTPPQRPEVPQVDAAAWVENPVDAFVLAQLEERGWKPSARADRTTLLRRLSLDLLGLPPTFEELDEFLNDDSPGAYHRAVERLLASAHFGERWGRVWLDVARYADSDGFEKDKPRQVWMYRDWVIDALNRDMPYDEFVVKQVAGDMLADATQDDLVATGFLRNSMTNQEGGIDPEQFRMEAMFDRMDAIGKAVLGLTIQCAQCHTHKYDPLSHTDYYRMFAFINNCHEAQVAAYTQDDLAQRQQVLDRIEAIEARLRRDNPDWRARMAEWEERVGEDQPPWAVVRPELDGSGGQKHSLLDDGSILAAGYAPSKFSAELSVDVTEPKISAIRLELMNHPSLPQGGPGRSVFGLCTLTEFKVSAAPIDQPEQRQPVKIASATADIAQPRQSLEDIFVDPKRPDRWTGPIEYATDGDELTAWGIDQGPGRSNVPRKAVFQLAEPIENDQGVRLTFTLEQMHGDTIDYDTQTNNLGRFRLSITRAEDASADPLPAEVRRLLEVPAEERSPRQQHRIFSYWRTTVPEWQAANEQIESLWRQHPEGTSQLVLQERDVPRATHRLERGSFLQPAEQVTPGVPSFLHPLDEPDDPDRLDFARWLVERRAPTTARSIVNRIWQAYFGSGLVTTAGDLGTQGDTPSHPELLDWLAVELLDHDWRLKHIHRLIVTSAAYQQASRVTPEMLAADPVNRWLQRGPRFRVDAEVVRDIALTASGLLQREVGGPSVYPPAPEFLFQRPTSFAPKVWDYDTGPDRYRRALYTFRYRSVPYPMLQNFDAPSGEVACARRVRSNTPLQALTTLNETLFMECARALAAEAVAAGGSSDGQRIAFVVRRCVAREPSARELHVLEDFLDQQKQRFDQGHLDAESLISAGAAAAGPSAGGTDPADLAAWIALARVVLNLDETITKE